MEKNSAKTIFHRLINLLEGSFDNFQQAWQENTEEDIHRLEVEQKHRHIHTKFEKQQIFNEHQVTFILQHYENRNQTKIIAQHTLDFFYDDKLAVVFSLFSPLIIDGIIASKDRALEKIMWHQQGNRLEGYSVGHKNTVFKVIGNKLTIKQKEGFYANLSPYHFIKCRYFSGWIEYPNPERPTEIYRMGDLKLHDQGGMIPLTFANGTRGIYTVELTQLVFAKTLHIMKLGVYEESYEKIHYSSKAISYTWTSPASKRIGINLRKVSTGWTFIEPGFVSSNNMDLKKKE